MSPLVARAVILKEQQLGAAGGLGAVMLLTSESVSSLEKKGEYTYLCANLEG